MTSAAGTYRIGDGAPVSFESAQALWTSMARDVLVETARRYNAYVTSSQLAAEVQTRSGIRTKMLMPQWIGGVLGSVSDDCAQRGEPLLTALCVGEDGSVNDGYPEAVERTSGSRPVDVELHAAGERLNCYRHFGAELPEDGGRPQLTRRVAMPAAKPTTKRAAAKKTATPKRQVVERPVAICPTCFMQLPSSGRCDTCG